MEKIWEMDIVSLIIIGLSVVLFLLYLFMLTVGCILRNRFLKKYKTIFKSFDCRLSAGNFFNPLNTYIRVAYKGKEFLMMEGEARPDRTGYRGELRTKLRKLSPFDLRYKHLPKDISESKDYVIIGNYLIHKLREEDFSDLREKAQPFLDDLLEKALLFEKTV